MKSQTKPFVVAVKRRKTSKKPPKSIWSDTPEISAVSAGMESAENSGSVNPPGSQPRDSASKAQPERQPRILESRDRAGAEQGLTNDQSRKRRSTRHAKSHKPAASPDMEGETSQPNAAPAVAEGQTAALPSTPEPAERYRHRRRDRTQGLRVGERWKSRARRWAR